MDFHSLMVGSNARARTRSYQIKENIDLNWVQITRIKQKLNLAKEDTGLSLFRNQIPLISANGMTIAEAQGSPIPSVVVCTKGSSRKKLSMRL